MNSSDKDFLIGKINDCMDLVAADEENNRMDLRKIIRAIHDSNVPNAEEICNSLFILFNNVNKDSGILKDTIMGIAMATGININNEEKENSTDIKEGLPTEGIFKV